MSNNPTSSTRSSSSSSSSVSRLEAKPKTAKKPLVPTTTTTTTSSPLNRGKAKARAIPQITVSTSYINCDFEHLFSRTIDPIRSTADPKFKDAVLALRSEKYRQTLRLCDSGLKENKKSPAWLILKAICIEVDPSSPDKSFVNEAEALYESAINLAPAYPHSFIQSGKLHLVYAEFSNNRERQLKLAKDRFVRAIAIDPKSDTAHASLAYTLDQLGEKDLSRTHREKALAINKDCYLANQLKGIELYQAGQYKEALSFLNPGSKKVYPYININTIRGLCLLKVGDYKHAAKCLHRAFEENPNDTLTQFGTAVVAFNLKTPGSIDIAIMLLKKVTLFHKTNNPKDPQYAEALYYLGLSYKNKGQLNLAKITLTEAAKHKSEFTAQTQIEIGKIQEKLALTAPNKQAVATAKLKATAAFVSALATHTDESHPSNLTDRQVTRVEKKVAAILPGSGSSTSVLAQ